MESYKIIDFLKEDLTNFLDREIIVNTPLLKARGTIFRVSNTLGCRDLLVKGFVKGRTFKGVNIPSSPNSQVTFQILVDDLIRNYKTDRIRIVII